MIYLIRNKYARTQTWQWIRDNWEWIKITFSGDKSYNDYPRYVATALSTDEQLQQYRDFFMALHSDPALSRTIDMGINEIKNRVDIIKRDGPSVIEALLKL
jgi:aminopeptidase N